MDGTSSACQCQQRHCSSVRVCSSIPQCMSEQSASAAMWRLLRTLTVGATCGLDAFVHAPCLADHMCPCMPANPAFPNLSCIAVATERRVSGVKPSHSSGSRGKWDSNCRHSLDAGQRAGRSGEAALWGTSGTGLKQSSYRVHRT